MHWQILISFDIFIHVHFAFSCLWYLGPLNINHKYKSYAIYDMYANLLITLKYIPYFTSNIYRSLQVYIKRYIIFRNVPLNLHFLVLSWRVEHRVARSDLNEVNHILKRLFFACRHLFVVGRITGQLTTWHYNWRGNSILLRLDPLRKPARFWTLS